MKYECALKSTFWLMTCVLLAGCPTEPGSESDGGSESTEDADGGAEPTGDGGSLDTVDGGGEELDTTRDPACTEGNWVVQLSGEVLDQNENGVSEARVQICVRTSPDEQFLCLQPKQVNADGSFAYVFPDPARCVYKATARVFVPTGDTTTAYCHLDLREDVPLLEVGHPYTLVNTAAPTTLPTLGAGDAIHTLVFSDGLEVDVQPDLLGFGYETIYPTLAAAFLSSDSAAICLEPDLGIDFVGFYGFSPENNVQGAPYTMRIPTAGLTLTGTSVDIYALGGLTCKTEDDELIPEGDWVKVATGTVSSDGTYIESDALNCFGTIGIANPNE